MLHKINFEDSGRRGTLFTNWIVSPEFEAAFNQAIKEECERLGCLSIEPPVQEEIKPKPVGFMEDKKYSKMIRESLERVYLPNSLSLEEQVAKYERMNREIW